MCGTQGFAENLNVQNCKNSTANCVHYIFTECLSLQKIWLSRTVKIQLEIVYTIYVRNVSICRKILYPELRKFNGKLCTLYIYGTSLFAENLIIQNYENSTGNCVHELSWFEEKLNFQNRVIWTGNCIHNMYGMSGFAENLNIWNCENSTRNCVHYIFTERLDLLKNWI